MGLQNILADQIVTRLAGAQANGPAIHTGGQSVDIHGVGPAVQVMGVQVSNDGYNWVAATDADGANITNVNATNFYREIRERAEFVRGITAAGVAGPDYHFRFIVHKLVA